MPEKIYTGTVTKTISEIERLPRLSKNGNPVHEVRFTDGTATKTQVDGSINHRITNSEYQDMPLRIQMERGRIVNATPIQGDQA